jgi:PAS domain S-box-containing protein
MEAPQMDSLNLIPKDVPQDVVDLDSIITTAELRQRPSRPPDYAAENRALVALTQALAHPPDGILQKLAETALTLCQAHSAGVSLLEPDGKSFFWPAVVGQWACHAGGGTPRDYGPCGTVLDRDAAQLMSHPERHFTPFASVTPLIEEALVTPFYVEGRAVGTVWIIAHDQSRRFDSEDLRVMTNLGKFAATAYQALRESEHRYRRLFETAREGILILDHDTRRITDANPFMTELLGYTREELIGKELFEIGLLRDEQESQAVFRRLREERFTRYENLPLRTKAGRRLEVEVVANLYQENGRPVIQSHIRDIAERKRAEEALRESEAKYHTLFDSMDEGYSIIQMLYDADGKPVDWRVLEVNPAFEKHIGVAGAKGKTVRELGLAVEPRWIEIYGHVAETGESLRSEEYSETLRRTFDLYAFRIGAPEERKVAVLFSNITDRKRAEEALRESERRTQEHAAELADLHRRKDEFLAMLSHELRNPLSPILNAAHILRLQKDENPLQQQARAVIERQVNQLSLLINDLLEVSRVITGRIQLRPERLDIRGVVEHALESARPLIDQRGHQLFVSLPAEAVWLEGDVARLEQVVVNLLNNAAKYTQEGGKIWVNLQSEGDEVTLRVRDTGVGIAPELQLRIFDLFTQADRTPDRSQGGLGIGLSLTQRLVELHRGKIEAHSAGLGQGSEFIVRLPVSLSSERGTDMTSTGMAKQAAQGWRMLVVDDNVDAANMLAAMLQHYGHQTETVYSAQGALEVAVESRPDFVMLDIGLPWMDGYEVARRLRQIPELKDTRLIAATGYGQDVDRQRSEEAGFDYHLVKPIDPEKLQTVLELLGRLPRSAK